MLEALECQLDVCELSSCHHATYDAIDASYHVAK